jgi:hypothetical protein
MDGLRRHLRDCNRWRPDDYLPFVVAGRPIGRMRHDLAEGFAALGAGLLRQGDAIVLSPTLTTAAARTAALAEIVDRAVAAGLLAKRRGEDYPLLDRWGGQELGRLDRGAVAAFGVPAFGVHLNGFTPDDAAYMWLGVRALDKPVAPGKLDNIVAGGQPAGLSVRANLEKECAEEAAIPASLAARAVAVGALSYCMAVPEGLRRDRLFLFDLAVPPDFVPRNTDGEVDSFRLVALDEVARIVRETDDFKFNVALTVIDFLIRHGRIGPDDPGYLDLVEGLRQPF